MRKLKDLSHQEKMQIYNNEKLGMYYVKTICNQLDISFYTYKKAYADIEELIKKEIDSECDKHPTVCNICGGKVLFNKCDKQKSRSGFVYYCTNCYAWVGTYPHNPTEAMGYLANKETRQRRANLHRWFDKLWRNHEEREIYYDKLAKELGLQECHFAQLSDKQMDRAEELIKKWWFEKYDK